MIRTLNLNRKTTAILENAYAIGYEKEVNSIWQASFSLPLNDPKVEKIKMLEYVEIDDVGLFRIMPKQTKMSSNEVTFQCEHVLSTLLDACLFKYHQLTNYKTRQVIEYLLDQQEVKHWELRKCDFERRFHYSWENENGVIAPLFSVPKAFDESYMWQFDTSTYPWQIDLIKPANTPTCRIKEGYNLVDFEIEEDPMNVINRVYPLGAGEGINQLTIESVNKGIPYVEDRQPGEEIKKYVWPDKRFTDAQSLKDSAIALLNEWKKPKITWKTSAADVSSITGLSIDELKCGTVVRLQVDNYPTTDLRIMKESKSDITGSPGDVQLEIGNVTEDLSTTTADLERRQQINELYSQGATNIMNFTYQDNCDDKIPAVIPFFVDDDVVNINTIELTYRTKSFRAYSKATKGGGAIVKSTKGGGGTVKSTSSGGATTQTTTSGGSTTATSSSGGGTSKSTSSGGSTTQTSSAGGNHRHVMFTKSSQQGPTQKNTFASQAGLVALESSADKLTTAGSSGTHSHSVSVPAHSHNFSTPNHTHSVKIPNHSHKVKIPAHKHEVNLPNHTHEIELPDHTHDVHHEIVELNTVPNKVVIKVDGNVVDHTNTSGDRVDLTDYMSKDDGGRINRGRHEVEILPGGLARIEADLILRVFIQSQLGGKF